MDKEAGESMMPTHFAFPAQPESLHASVHSSAQLRCTSSCAQGDDLREGQALWQILCPTGTQRERETEIGLSLISRLTELQQGPHQ